MSAGMTTMQQQIMIVRPTMPGQYVQVPPTVQTQAVSRPYVLPGSVEFREPYCGNYKAVAPTNPMPPSDEGLCEKLCDAPCKDPCYGFVKTVAIRRMEENHKVLYSWPHGMTIEKNVTRMPSSEAQKFGYHDANDLIRDCIRVAQDYVNTPQQLYTNGPPIKVRMIKMAVPVINIFDGVFTVSFEVECVDGPLGSAWFIVEMQKTAGSGVFEVIEQHNHY